jgi:hypothetical protein
MIIASLLASSYFFAQARQEAANMQAMSRDTTRLRVSKAELEALDHELSRKKQVIKLILGERPPPVPAWFLAYLSDSVPPELVVTNLHIVREEDYYKVQVAGTTQRALPASATPPVADPVDVLKAKLAGPPFHLRIIEKADQKPLPATTTKNNTPIDTSVPGWLSRLAGAVTGRSSAARSAAQEDHFVIEGIMR